MDGEKVEGLVSVVLPTFNRSRRLVRAAVDSVLSQEAGQIEVIVVDDGSDESALELLDGYGDDVRFHRQDNGGISAARNAGVALARGQYLAFVDSDDLWAEGKLKRQFAVFTEQPEIEAVYGRAQQFFDEEADDEFRRLHPIKDEVVDSWISTSMLIKRSAFDRVGAFDTALDGALDLDWHQRTRTAELACEMLPQVVYLRRIHPGAGGIVNRASVTSDRLRALKAGLDRRRSST